MTTATGSDRHRKSRPQRKRRQMRRLRGTTSMTTLPRRRHLLQRTRKRTASGKAARSPWLRTLPVPAPGDHLYRDDQPFQRWSPGGNLHRSFAAEFTARRTRERRGGAREFAAATRRRCGGGPALNQWTDRDCARSDRGAHKMRDRFCTNKFRDRMRRVGAEPANGGDVPREFRKPWQPQMSKSQLREMLRQALQNTASIRIRRISNRAKR